MGRQGSQSPALIFLPALCLFPVWLTIGIREDMVISSISKNYPMMLAMVVGSMIAGSTPLGGGIVAFPVSVLILGFSPDQGRDFSLLIQSVGMTASSYLIFVKKRHLLKEGCGNLLPRFCVLSIMGMIIGFEGLNDFSPYIVNIVYTTSVTCIVIVLAYIDLLRKNIVEHGSGDEEQIAMTGAIVSSEEGESYDLSRSSFANKIMKRMTQPPLLNYLFLSFFAIAGGILSSQIGTGADIACFFFGSIYNNSMGLTQKNDEGTAITTTRVSENALTAMSVIVMANTSIFGSILRLTTTEILGDSESSPPLTKISEEVYSVLFACAPVVVLGAPIGSLFLTPSNQITLKRFFYALGIVQLLSFGIIKIGNDIRAWISIICIIAMVCFLVFLHHLRRILTIVDNSTMHTSTAHEE